MLPGPLPPHSHFGVTLLRHVVATGLRSALHRLGLPLIPVAPVRVVELRLYLDRDALARQLEGVASARQAIGALIDPAGVAERTPGDARLAGAGLLHRVRLRRPPRLRRPVVESGPPLEEFRFTLTALLPALSDALLAELLSALARRRDRADGRQQPPCLSHQAWRFHNGRSARLDCLGPPEPLLASWAVTDAPLPPAGESPPRHRYRGRFREQYRAALDLLTPSYRRLAELATAGGLLDDPSDAFFLPLDLADDLAADHRPAWLAPAIATNRREYMACRTRPAPPDLIDADVESGPLNPLP
jgi:hypothetical protein